MRRVLKILRLKWEKKLSDILRKTRYSQIKMHSGLAFINLILHVPCMMLISTNLTNFFVYEALVRKVEKKCVQNSGMYRDCEMNGKK
jgi:hypothetical protein